MKIAAALVVVGPEPFEVCLASLRNFDAVYAFVERRDVADSIQSTGATVLQIEAPACIEDIGEQILTAAPADWLLLIDPDEEFTGDVGALRDALSRLPAEVPGCNITYRYDFLGQHLERTYRDLRKAKLVRPSRVRWERRIHSVPTPKTAGDQFIDLPPVVATIRTELVAGVENRLLRHMQWARIESTMTDGAGPLDAETACNRIVDVLNEYCGKRECADDGVAGLLNALLHVNKGIAGLLFEAERRGLAQTSPTALDSLRRAMLRLIRSVSSRHEP